MSSPVTWESNQRTTPKRDYAQGIAAATNGALERHLTVKKIAELWGLSENSVREIFKAEPGIVRIQRPGSRCKRGYTSIRIPESVVERVHRTMSTRS